MGSAKAAAQHVNNATVQALLDQVKAELDVCKQFEVAYAKRLNLEQSLGTRSPSTAPGARPASVPHSQKAGGMTIATRPEPVKHVEESALQQNKRRPAQKIPTIAPTSNLLRGTVARIKYREAVLAGAENSPGQAMDVSTRSSGYPTPSAGALKPGKLPTQVIPHGDWERPRLQLKDCRNNAQKPHTIEQQRHRDGESTNSTKDDEHHTIQQPNGQMQQHLELESDRPSDWTQGQVQGDVALRTMRSGKMDFSVPHADLMRALYNIDS